MTNERIDAIQTRWSLIRGAHLSGNGQSVSEARGLLVLRYAPAIRRYVGAMVRNDDQADEISQEIVLRLMRGDFSGADPARGRFRDFLITSIRNAVRTFWTNSRRKETRSIALAEQDDRQAATDEAAWLHAWQQSVLEQTWNRLRAEEGDSPSLAISVLKQKTDSPDLDSAELALRLSQQTGQAITADNFRQILKRTRRRFAEHLLDEIRSSLQVETEDAVQEELAALQLLEHVRDFLPAP